MSVRPVACQCTEFRERCSLHAARARITPLADMTAQHAVKYAGGKTCMSCAPVGRWDGQGLRLRERRLRGVLCVVVHKHGVGVHPAPQRSFSALQQSRRY